MAKIFFNIYQQIKKRKTLSLVGMLFAILGLFYVSFNIQFEEDITKLIPVNDKNENAGKIFKTVNFADKIIVNISKSESGTLNDLSKYASQFLDSLYAKAPSYVASVQGKVEDEEVLNTLNFVYDNLPLFLDGQDYETIKQKLDLDSIERITEANYKTLVSPSGFVTKKQIVKDPLGLGLMGLKKLQSLSFGDKISLHDGFLVSEDKNHILLFISPTFPSSETGENAKFADLLYQINKQLNAEFKGKASCEYFGGALVAVENAKQIKHDIQFTVGIAMTVLLLILILFYKKLLLPIILFVPTLFGGLLAMTLLFFIREKISAVSLGIGSVLLGVTLDYSLHVLTHIRASNNMKALFEEITKPILMSSLTTALAFLCLLFLESQALQDLGIFAATSVIGASFFALVFIPQAYKDSIKLTDRKSLIDRFAEIPFHKKKVMFVILGGLILISLFKFHHVSFNKDITKLNYEPPKLMEAQNRLEQITNIGSKSVYVAAFNTELQKALQTNDSVYSTLKKLESNKEITDFSSIGGLVKSIRTQDERIAEWQSFWDESTKNDLKKNLILSGEKFGFKPKTHQDFYSLLDKDFNSLSVESYQAINAIQIEDYVSTKDGFSTVTSLVKLDSNEVKNIHEKFDSNPHIFLIDRQGMNETFLGNLKNDFNDLVLYSLLAVLFILFAFYRSFSLTLVTSIPIGLTWFFTIGLMGLFGIEFNIFNIIISTFIFGLGIDYSIFITNGLLHEYRTGEAVLPTHKTSIILSVITTILGVGVMIFAKHPALYTISLVSIIGILSAMVNAFTVQPLLFQLFIGSNKKRPISFRYLVFAIISFSYYGLGTVIIPIIGTLFVKILPISRKKSMPWFHKLASKFMTSVLYSNPFVKKKVINEVGETFEKPAIIISNHTSFLDTLALEMLYPKIIFLVNDWVYKSPIFGYAMKFTGYYPVSEGIDKGMDHLKEKIEQGYSIVVFPEGTRSYTHKMKRFHKGAFHLAEEFQLDILPVLIHGNSEVIPKGSFVIRDGSITLKVLERISPQDPSFGTTTREKTKQISAHFKNEFFNFRREIEDGRYFHRLLLEEYRYKGDTLYQTVKKDIFNNKDTYHQILDELTEYTQVAHLSKDFGAFDFLMALDKPERKISVFTENLDIRTILKNSFLTNSPHYNLHFNETISSTIHDQIEVVVIDAAFNFDIFTLNSLPKLKKVMLIKDGISLKNKLLENYQLTPTIENEKLIILKLQKK